MRIVSLLPSATEILFAVGAGGDVVGVTFECDFPAEARSRTIVSTSTLTSDADPREIDAQVKERLAAGEDLYRLDEGALAALDADLVVTQDLCAVCAVDVSNVDAALAHLGSSGRVLTVDPGTLDEVLESVATIGAATGREAAAGRLVARLRDRLERVRRAVPDRPRPRVAVLEWTDPPFTSGHWVPDMVAAAGATPVLGAAGGRSAQTSWDDIAAARPDILVVAPCGYRLPAVIPLAEAVLDRAPRAATVWAIDADAVLVRPGPRLVDGVEAMAGLVHPGAVPARPDLAVQVR